MFSAFRTFGALGSQRGVFDVVSLFRAGEQGVWYDPSDLSTLFQDSAGTTPVTASGQPVGRMLDKSGRGNHATQPTAGSRPIFRRGDSRGVVNLLTNTESASTSSETSGVTYTENAALSPRGDMSADKVEFAAGAHKRYRSDYSTNPQGKTFNHSVWLRSDSPVTVSLRIVSLAQPEDAFVVAALTTEWQRVDVARAFALSGTAVRIGLDNRSAYGSDEAAKVIYIWGAQLNLGPTALPYQRNDSHLGGVATGDSTDLHWLETDGVDDGMATGNIDFTGTDKVSVFAGVRKLSDAATAAAVELSVDGGATNGSFTLAAPTSTLAGGSFSFNVRGTTLSTSRITGYPAPVSKVLTVQFDISGTDAQEETRARVDGVNVTHDGHVSAGTGTYGNYPLYLFRRGGTTLPFNGWFYGLAITGRLTTDAEIAATERFLAAKSAVVIP